ncbi:Hypothetical predicted protein [Cloeon dipterum]|uniref:Uncharacterized protein n=1 Tax=Cloeon dipterum TaxID=197152 RepID=A0A8S1DSB1_9INSE|nr:Hypothetical predicted protein [Cloeon dipterum]
MEPVRDFAAPPRFLGPPVKAGEPIPSPAPPHAYERMVAAQVQTQEGQPDPNGPAVCGMALHDPAHLPLGAGGPAPPVLEETPVLAVCPPRLPLGAGGPAPRKGAPVIQDDIKEKA